MPQALVLRRRDRATLAGALGPVPMPIPYDLNKPSWTCRLPKALQELSGLALSPSGEFAWAVNDEEGVLYRVQLQTGDVTRGSKFAKRGDYEGIAAWDEAVAVVRSDGRLCRVTAEGEEDFKSPLRKKSDVEGLCHDAAHNRLLVACKGPSRGRKDERHIYAVTLPDFEWSADPVYVVDYASLQEFLRDRPGLGVEPKQAKNFAPSAIAIAPVSGHIYLLSSRAKMLLALDADTGRPRSAAPLSRALFPQPEALDFDGQGRMYLGSEGRGGEALLHRFDPL